MDTTPRDYAIVFKTHEQAECRESHLVLDAAGISAESDYRDGWWWLVVDRRELTAAAAELDAYRHENPGRARHRSPGVPIYAGAVTAVCFYAGTLLLVALLTAPRAFGPEWLAIGRMQAGQVMAGEWWRTVTALTLHLDAGHIIANLLFGAVFGFLAGRVLGGGVAWLAIIVAGALGNWMNAAVQPPTHLSIGASTAVFAALGVIVSHALRPRTPVPEKRMKRWSPLVGGVVLLAFTGVGGERTDVIAHLTGFSAGLLTGWLGCRLPNHWLASRGVQKGAGFVALAIVASAWIVGLLVAG